MKKLLAFNWKENPSTLAEAEKLAASVLELAKNVTETEIVVCPPDVYLQDLSSVISHKSQVKLGAQNISTEDAGAHTGEVSGAMLKNLGATYVIVGHSERRRMGETDEVVNKKIAAALENGLNPILCIGEELSIRDQGMEAVKEFINNQLKQDLEGIENCLPAEASAQAGKLKIENLTVAYEPIWAIGTGKPCKPEDALEVIRFIKELLVTSYQLLVTRVLYGGSVTGKNIMDFIQLEDIDGALVGGASLEPLQFLRVVH